MYLPRDPGPPAFVLLIFSHSFLRFPRTAVSVQATDRPACQPVIVVLHPTTLSRTGTHLPMPTYSLEEIRQCFSASTDFNEIFDVFQSALAQKITDFELYRLLFWNPSLTPDEIRLFGEKLAGEFPGVAYEVFFWLAGMFEATYSSSDNHELALHYYMKAAAVNPSELDPYMKACDCHEPDLNIPPALVLIEFVKSGLPHVPDPVSMYKRLADLYAFIGDQEMGEFYRLKSETPPEPPPPPPPEEGDRPSA